VHGGENQKFYTAAEVGGSLKVTVLSFVLHLYGCANVVLSFMSLAMEHRESIGVVNQIRAWFHRCWDRTHA
jgi:hypothetical protein